MRVFLDTGAWIARQIKADENNLAAKKYYNNYKKQRALFYTNDYVLAETYTRLIYDAHLDAAYQFYRSVVSSVSKRQLVVLEIDEKEREQCWGVLKKYSDHKLSFADTTIVVNFKELNLDEIFTFDRHFRDIGFPTNLS